MKWINEKFIYIILIFINFNFILRLLEKGIYIENFNYGFTSLLLLIGFLIYCFYQCVLKKSIYKILFTMAIFSMMGIYYINKAYTIRNIVSDYFSNNILILNDLIYEGSITYFNQYKIIFILIIPLIISLILWITFRFMKKFILIVTFGAVLTLWFSSSYDVVIKYLFIYIFISLLTFIIMGHIKRIERYKSEGVKIALKFRYILVYGVIVSLLISKIATMLPQDYNGQDLTRFGNYFNNEFSSDSVGTSSANKDRYSLSSSGYDNNEKRLGGPISLNYQEVFKVKSDKPYYLKGNVMDFYNGSKWTKANESYYKKTSSGDMQFVSYGSSVIGIKKSITIYPGKKFATNTIFAPNYAFNVSGVEEIIYYDKAATALSKVVIKAPYLVYFYGYSDVIDTIEDVRELEKKLLEKNRVQDDLLISYVYKYVMPMDYLLQPKARNVFTDKNLPIEVKYSFRNSEDFKLVKNYGEYLQVPQNISKRTYDLVQDITKDAHTSIDKVLQIKNYLTKNYVYDLQVSVIPEKSEFIDYFLFVEKKGYCTYFNTAMTVMSRIAGVPARYVEGFKIPDKKDASGLYTVSNSDAHAWCEVLLGASEYSNMWTIADASPTATEDMARKLKQLEQDQRNSGDSGDAGINTVRKPKNIIDGNDPSQGASTSNLMVLSDLELKAINILTTIILFILMRIIEVLKRRGKLLKSKKVTPLYNYYMYRLATIKIVKPEYQGDLEFAEELPNSVISEKIKNLVKVSYEENFGKHLITTLNNREYYEFLETYLKGYEGRFKYLLNKYLGTLK